jgi:hypothetical protein
MSPKAFITSGLAVRRFFTAPFISMIMSRQSRVPIVVAFRSN